MAKGNDLPKVWCDGQEWPVVPLCLEMLGLEDDDDVDANMLARIHQTHLEITALYRPN